VGLRQIKYVAIALISLLCIACGSGAPQDITDPGELLFLGFAAKGVNCARCHGPQGHGGLDAPDIRRAPGKYSDEEIADFIASGKGEGPSAMPPMEARLTEAQIAQIISYLKTLQVN